jgi:hypothetical protein
MLSMVDVIAIEFFSKKYDELDDEEAKLVFDTYDKRYPED